LLQPPSSLASFRDPGGIIVEHRGRIFRLIARAGADDIKLSLESPALREFVAAGRLIGTVEISVAEAEEALRDSGLDALVGSEEVLAAVEHERVPLRTFPYEWPPEMLHAAAALTLDLALALLDEGMGLKDATPYNILFRGPRPVFVDWLSFERREPRDPVWLPEAQFARTFLLPLLAGKHYGLRPDQLLLSKRDGLEPAEVYRLCSPLERFRPPFLTLATIPTLLGARQATGDASIYRPKTSANAEKARFILQQQFKRLRRLLKKVGPDARRASAWTDYIGPRQHFTDEYLLAKQAFVEQALEEFRPRTVLDVGCNTGHFSRVAARAGAAVTAIDQDPAVVGEAWRAAQAEGLDVLPLVVDITRPSPGVGWRNGECPSFLDRMRGQPDAVMMLALLHHMMVSERIPLPQILELAAELTRDLLLVEFVAPEDPMFRRIARGRDALYSGLTNDGFRDACAARFEIVRAAKLAQSDRWLYLLKKKR
jgi:SAM-dependent methyltransferase